MRVVGSTVTFDFGEVKHFAKLGIYFWKYDTRTTGFKAEISSDGVNFTQIFDGESTKNIRVNVLDVNADARYVRLTSKGNNENEWFNVMEIVGYGDDAQIETTLR